MLIKKADMKENEMTKRNIEVKKNMQQIKLSQQNIESVAAARYRVVATIDLC
jgi:hypothetical protein